VELLPALANASGWAVAVATLLFVIRSLSHGDLVAGSVHRRALDDLAFWRDRALVGTSLAEAGADVAEQSTDGA